MNQTSSSPFASINLTDFQHVAIHFAISALISIALYALDKVVPQINFGSYTAIAVPVVTTVSAAIKRYLTDYQAVN